MRRLRPSVIVKHQPLMVCNGPCKRFSPVCLCHFCLFVSCGPIIVNNGNGSARKQELRELIENSDSQLEELRQAHRDAEKTASEAEKSLQAAVDELERVRPFEKEIKEKNLLIGKLRHEAVTLNDHLTKALRFLKKGKPEDNVDRYLLPRFDYTNFAK